MTVRAIYQDGVFKPSTPVDLPDRAEVELEIVPAQVRCEENYQQGRQELLKILSRRYRTGRRDAAARHNEHQPLP